MVKISTVAEGRFTVETMAYSQMFIDYLHAKDRFKLKFFDECGLIKVVIGSGWGPNQSEGRISKRDQSQRRVWVT